jgi:hypothetical protein
LRGGDVIAALRITLIANAFLEAEIDRLDDPAGMSNFTALAQRLDRHLVNRFPTDPSLGSDPIFSVSLSLGCAAGCDATRMLRRV